MMDFDARAGVARLKRSLSALSGSVTAALVRITTLEGLRSEAWIARPVVAFDGDQASINLSGGHFIKASAATAMKLVTLTDRSDTQPVYIQFIDGNVTLTSYNVSAGGTRRADGMVEDYRIPAGAILRFVFDGTYWIADGGGINALASINKRQRIYGIGADGVKRGMTVGGRLKVRNAVIGPRFDIPARNHVTAHNWPVSFTANNNHYFGICWAAELGLFVGVAYSGTGNRVQTSPDGITWTARTSAADYEWMSVCWSPELRLLVAVARTGTGNRVMTSPDGVNWTLRASAADNSWDAVCWSQELGLFCAAATSGTNRIMTSPDGTVWTARVTPGSYAFEGICWSPDLGLFCAVATTGNRAITSNDGISWTERTVPGGNWRDVCWAAELGLFVAVSYSLNAGAVITSPDGVTWSQQSTPGTGSAICWSPEIGLLVVVGDAGTASQRIMTSPDGVNWTYRTMTASLNTVCVCWAAEIGIFCSLPINSPSAQAITSVSTLIRSPQPASRIGVPARATVTLDAAFTLTHGVDAPLVRHTEPLTADRTVTLSTANAVDGASFRITRTGSGAFNLNVGGLKNLIQNTWCIVTYHSTGWRLDAYGAL